MFLLIEGFILYNPDGTIYFNTSHVSINPFPIPPSVIPSVISIHLMFLLIQIIGKESKKQNNFNTSHVSINRRNPYYGKQQMDFNTSHVSINL